jgi:hypothetical protein
MAGAADVAGSVPTVDQLLVGVESHPRWSVRRIDEVVVGRPEFGGNLAHPMGLAIDIAHLPGVVNQPIGFTRQESSASYWQIKFPSLPPRPRAFEPPSNAPQVWIRAS